MKIAESLDGFWVTAIMLLFAIAIVIQFYGIIREVINYFFKDHINRYLLTSRLKPHYKEVLIEKFGYYHHLNDQDKSIFEKRVQKFINIKEFVPRGGIKHITVEMKVLIAASAIQLTFGYPSIYFMHFRKIILYKTDYYSNITQKYHQGEVNTRGFIILSWVNFVKGYNEAGSGRNLGLHELAHALKIENAIRNNEYNFIDENSLKSFYRLAKHEIEKIRLEGSSFFRSYAGTNVHEFFAIVVENFFERPEQFYRYDQELYLVTTQLLKQDPLYHARL